MATRHQIQRHTNLQPAPLNTDSAKQVIKVLTDPTSSGQGGRPDEPLLLVRKLAADETDAVFGAFESILLRRAADAGSWSPLPGGFNRWVEMYHRKVLHGSRPVLVTVHVSRGFASRCRHFFF